MQPVARIDAGPLLDRPGVARLMALCRGAGAEARFVGGAVRDLLLDRPVGDIDIAIDTPPDETLALLRDAGIATLDYGFAHGTVAAVVDSGVVEFTTLRVDAKALGRHAEVAFTDNWQADAERRDFTINALYLDADGRLYDPCGGRDDLAAGRIRFVGEAAARIAEDRLRILRFFRFLAWFGTADPEPAALAACAAAAGEIDRLSGERLRAEMLKLLRASAPIGTLLIMADAGVLGAVMPVPADIPALERLVAAEAAYAVQADPIRRLAALLSAESDAARLAERWRLSRLETARLLAAVAPSAEISAALGRGDAPLLLYLCGHQTAEDLALLKGDAALAGRLATTPLPVFPLKGRDILQLGVPSGKAVGARLEELKTWWIAGGFQADRKTLLAELLRRLHPPQS